MKALAAGMTYFAGCSLFQECAELTIQHRLQAALRRKLQESRQKTWLALVLFVILGWLLIPFLAVGKQSLRYRDC